MFYTIFRYARRIVLALEVQEGLDKAVRGVLPKQCGASEFL